MAEELLTNEDADLSVDLQGAKETLSSRLRREERERVAQNLEHMRLLPAMTEEEYLRIAPAVQNAIETRHGLALLLVQEVADWRGRAPLRSRAALLIVVVVFVAILLWLLIGIAPLIYGSQLEPPTSDDGAAEFVGLSLAFAIAKLTYSRRPLLSFMASAGIVTLLVGTRILLVDLDYLDELLAAAPNAASRRFLAEHLPTAIRAMSIASVAAFYIILIPRAFRAAAGRLDLAKPDHSCSASGISRLLEIAVSLDRYIRPEHPLNTVSPERKARADGCDDEEDTEEYFYHPAEQRYYIDREYRQTITGEISDLGRFFAHDWLRGLSGSNRLLRRELKPIAYRISVATLLWRNSIAGGDIHTLIRARDAFTSALVHAADGEWEKMAAPADRASMYFRAHIGSIVAQLCVYFLIPGLLVFLVGIDAVEVPPPLQAAVVLLFMLPIIRTLLILDPQFSDRFSLAKNMVDTLKRP